MTLFGRRMLQTLVIAGVGALAGAERASAQAACDRACLRTMLDQYLQAVVKHDPKAYEATLPMNPAARYSVRKRMRPNACSRSGPNIESTYMFIKMWKKLPLPLANFMGPYIVRNLG